MIYPIKNTMTLITQLPSTKVINGIKKQIFSAFIGIILSKIYDLTLGADPHNTLGFVLLFTCLLACYKKRYY